MKIKEIIDLTYDLQEGMPCFNASWHPHFKMEQMGQLEVEGRQTHRVNVGTHSGTHIDSPLHFVPGANSIEKISLNTFIGEVSIVDMSDLGENAAVTADMLKDITITDRMLFKFGWGKYWNTGRFYQGYPFFAKEAAEYLISKGIKLAAMDTPSPDDSRIRLDKENLGTDKDSPIHKMFLQKGVILVEYVANLDKVKDYEGWNIIAMPLRIKDADGSPARVCIFRHM